MTPLKLILIFHCLNCSSPDSVDYIRIYKDSLTVMNTTWVYENVYGLDIEGDKVYSGAFILKNKSTNDTAQLVINGRNVLFTIPVINKNYRLYQIPHESRYYNKDDL